MPTLGELEQSLRLLGTFLDHLQGQGKATNSLRGVSRRLRSLPGLAAW